MPDLNAFGTWLLSVILYVPQKMYEYLTDSLIGLIDSAFALCTTCSVSGLNTALAAIPSALMFILSWFHPMQGLTIIFSAYTIRFLIRRLPFIG